MYQDGLPAGGELGRRIVEAAAAGGSLNYRLVLELLDRGAAVRKTEDPDLLLREHQNLRGPAREGSAEQGPADTEGYRRERDRLAKERGRHIAGAIAETLQVGETGVLFIGAHHEVIPRLPPDISVEMVKDRERVAAYFVDLLGGRDDGRLHELASYLATPVEGAG